MTTRKGEGPIQNVHAFGEALAKMVAAHGGPALEYLADDETMVFEDETDATKRMIRVDTFFGMSKAGRPLEEIADLVIRLNDAGDVHLDMNSARPLLHLNIVSDNFAPDGGIFRPLAPGMRLALVLDYPEFLRFLLPRDLAALGETEEVLWRIAEINTDAKLPTPTAETMPNGQGSLVFDCDLGGIYAWRYAVAQGSATVSVPHRDLGFVTLDSRPDSLALLALVTKSYFLEAEHPISPLVYRLEGGKMVGAGGAIRLPNANAS